MRIKDQLLLLQRVFLLVAGAGTWQLFLPGGMGNCIVLRKKNRFAR